MSKFKSQTSPIDRRITDLDQTINSLNQLCRNERSNHNSPYKYSATAISMIT